MTARTGGLLELVARGKKDLFFTHNPTVSYYHSVYKTASPTTKEIYQLMPRNTPEWGNWVDFDLEHKGDLASKFYLRIQLPTWLPPAVAALNPRSRVTYGSEPITYGYCQNVGYQMIKKVQVFNDTMLVEELYGEFLDWRLRGSYESGTVLTAAAQIGYREETPLAIGRSASPGLLRVPLPLLGWQGLTDPGFPLCVCRKQRFRVRVWLRQLEEIIVCSDGRLSPKPWNQPLTIQTAPSGPLDKTQSTLPYTSLKTITMSLETEQRYIPIDVRLFLQSRTLRIPFRHIQFQTTAVEHNSVVAASPPYNSSVTLPLPVEFIGPSDRFLLGFRTNAATAAGQRTLLTPMVSSVRLNIANIDRIKAWDPAIFREVSAYHKQARMPLAAYGSAVPGTQDVPLDVYTLTFGGYDYGRPAGTVSFTRATLPVLYITVAASTTADPRLPGDRGGFALLYCESWNVFQFANGGGKQMFDDV